MQGAPRILTALGLTVFAAGCLDYGTAPSDESRSMAKGAQLQVGYVRGPDGEPHRIEFEVREGRAVIEGDIDIGPAEAISLTPAGVLRAPGGPRFGMMIDEGAARRWAGGVVPYEIDSNLPSPQRVRDAFAYVRAYSAGVEFRARSSEQDYIYITRGSYSQSAVGRQGGKQIVYLRDAAHWGDVMHELVHALGMDHEQSRCDRDQYVEILWPNISSSGTGQFGSYCYGFKRIGDYDESSITHYGRYAFTWNFRPTIRSRRGRDAVMGQRSKLSNGDISTLSQTYRGTIPVHRLYNANWRDHLYSVSPNEGLQFGFRLEAQNYFYLSRATSNAHYAFVYRCLADGKHFISRDLYCEAGINAESAMGRVALWQMAGTVPLYRTRDPRSGDRLLTTSAGERQTTLNWGWVNEGIIGYVWPGP